MCNPYQSERENCVHFQRSIHERQFNSKLRQFGMLPHRAAAPVFQRLSPVGIAGTDCWDNERLNDPDLIDDDGFIHVVIPQIPCRMWHCCTLPYALRPHTLDMISLKNFFGSSEYKFLVDMHDMHPRYILDAGGVGMSAVWLSMLYPSATIIRLDPNPSNFAAGVENSKLFSNITQVNLGLWDRQASLQMCERAGAPQDLIATTNFYTRDVNDPPCDIEIPGRINVALLSNVMRTYNVPKFDIIKIDIEGAESRLFKDASLKDIIAASKIVVIELHERFVPGCEAAVNGVMGSLPFAKFHDDENDIWIKHAYMRSHKCKLGGG